MFFFRAACDADDRSSGIWIPVRCSKSGKCRDDIEQNGMTFTPEETNLIIEVMKQGKSKEEIARIEKIRMMMRLIK